VAEYCTRHEEREGLAGVYYCCREATKRKRSGARICYPVSVFTLAADAPSRARCTSGGNSDALRDGTGHSILGTAKRSALLLTSRLGVFCAMPASQSSAMLAGQFGHDILRHLRNGITNRLCCFHFMAFQHPAPWALLLLRQPSANPQLPLSCHLSYLFYTMAIFILWNQYSIVACTGSPLQFATCEQACD
jgi:hypothetical protein